ncbi:FkbM family methyltransferase [Streptomyces sp. NPDC059909]|uniref:FkbM family methyltransferase n=1 Tax=Streptomyces sp. NPDC059909 TaxID=3346998 RepID=UPI00364EE4AD
MTVHDNLRVARDTLFRFPGVQRAVRLAAMNGCVPNEVWKRLHPTGVWTLRAPDGSSFRYASDIDDILARSLIWTNMRHWEETTHPVIFDLARRARGFVDVGAFSGIYTLLACQANERLRAVAVEPNPNSMRKLRRNIEVNHLQDRVVLVEKALSNAHGRARLGIPADTTAASLLAEEPADRTVEVEVITGDDAVGDLAVDLVKIDVEGLEPEVLHGMSRTISAHRPTIIAECLDRPALDRLRESVHELGYRRIRHLGRSGPAPVPAGFVPPPRYANFLVD